MAKDRFDYPDYQLPENYPRSPLKAIRLFCLQCVGEQTEEVKACTSHLCPLYPYRFGKRPPELRKPLTEAQKEHMKMMRAKMKARRDAGRN